MKGIIKTIIEPIFKEFPRNMMILHITAAFIFLTLWQLEEHNKLKIKSSELIFGTFAIFYGLLCISYYVYFRLSEK